MKAIERVVTSLKRQTPDRVPILTFTDSQRKNMSQDLRQFLSTHTDMQYEFLPSEFSYLHFPSIGNALQKEERYLSDGWADIVYSSRTGRTFREVYCDSDKGYYRSFRKHVITDVQDVVDILDLPYVSPSNNESFIREVEEFSRESTSHNTENEFCIFCIHDPISLLASNTDPHNLAIWVREERELCRKYLETMCDRHIEYLSYVFNRFTFPAVFMLAGGEYAIPPLMSPEDFTDFVFAYDKKLCDLIHKNGYLIIVHCHGRVRNFILQFAEMGCDGLHPLEPVGSTGDCDLREVKECFGQQICLIGNIQYEVFDNESEHIMERTVAEAMDAAKQNGGFMLAPACPFYHRKLPVTFERNIRSFVCAGHKYGTY